MVKLSPDEVGRLRVIVPSLGTRFSGINASILAVLPEHAKRLPIAAVGFRLADGVPRIGFRHLFRH